MGSETDNGHWAVPYAAQFPFKIGDTQYIYGQDVGNPFTPLIERVEEDIVDDIATVLGVTWTGNPKATRRWFIQKVLPGGKVGDETDSGTWIGTYQVQFPYTIHGKQYFYAQDLRVKKWFIQGIDNNGKMGSEMENGTWDLSRPVEVPFALGGKQYFYGQDLSSRKWVIQQLK
jgi:hypothetical protein